MSDWIPNSFQLPNAFVDEAMKKLSPTANILYIVIVRKTRGWQKNVDAISLSQFEEITGLSRKTVVKAIAELVEFGFVKEYAQKTAKSAKSYELNTSVFSTLVESPLVENLHRTSGEIPLVTSGEIPHTKTTIKTTNTKTNISKEKPKKTRAEKSNDFDAKTVELPTHVDRDLWIQFVDMRNAKRKPLTENAVSLLIKKLNDFGVGANESLENSIIGGYQGLFAPKQPYVPASLNNQSEEPGYFNQVFHQYQESDVIDVTPDCAVVGGLTHV